MKMFVLASNNKNKVIEFQKVLERLDIEIESLSNYENIGEIEETGTTIEENALIKARTVSEITGLPAIADDTGLFVEALNGEPGVYSARYAGEGCSYSDNNKKLLNALENVADDNRKAVFCTAIAIVFPDGSENVVFGECHGTILKELRGEKGFGYDPVFYVIEIGKTFAEMDLSEKNKVSHRGKAIENFIKFIESM